jgi:hypothetical protein
MDMTFETKRNPVIAGLTLLFGVTLLACGENTKLIGTGASLTATPCDQCAAGDRPSCADGQAAGCFKRTDGTCGWGPQCAPAPGQSDAGTTPPPPDAGQTCEPQVCTAIFCQYGTKKDARGCTTCECNPPPSDPMCPAIACPTIYCPYGSTSGKDDKGCPTCGGCNPPPAGCAAVQCPVGQRCELRQVTCVKAPCDPVPMCVPDTGTNPCAAALCPPGTVCQAKPVVCVTAPCPPVAECVPQVHCGGFAARPCPGSGACVDDPTDSCDPAKGGADCGGMCVCKQPAECPPDRVWDNSPSVCACVQVPVGEPCGKNTCAADQFCCNKSCSICAPKGGACDAIACGP